MKIKSATKVLRDKALRKAVSNKTRVSKSSGESALKKAVKNVKEVIEKKQIENRSARDKLKESLIKKTARKKLPFTFKKGVVYLGHIPHGFFEEQMKDFFSQFGRVTRVRLVRSSKTGRSRGFGYVEFVVPEVAKIAAETMNNYLMCGRLMKATYIPPEKQHFGFFVGKSWSQTAYPTAINRKKITADRNSIISDNKHKQYKKKCLRNLTKLEEKLKAKGIDLKFTPVVDCVDEQT
ncbi:PREDICTED: MKI67 FHA domain-interacting nucleolar phosphoprotein [Polistes dominula]|uniref:MKI67 FHA domain-interacting nucleolar phosphoprotein n=1 Tax=Polistes dominula TaxID=743375 RepID=A0ABM1J1L8_POLDO|nr:PREDICTED: MKI67 FHA domain-interacting nucleolar phosphoprotein [Polistes dominula]